MDHSRFYAGSGTTPIQNMVLSRTSMSVYGCQTFGLVAQGSVPIRLSAVRTRGSQEAGCRSRGVEFAPDSPPEGTGFEPSVPPEQTAALTPAAPLFLGAARTSPNTP